MLWAIVNKEKIEAKPQFTGTCPLCDGKVFSKCGDVNVWHWSHFKDENCDSWYEPETYWHKHWKLTFGEGKSEITIKRNGKKHRADIQTEDKVVIELQNSPIQKSVIREREEFYGEKMLWLINGIDFKERFDFRDFVLYDLDDSRRFEQPENEKSFEWSYARRSWVDVQRPVFIDFGEESLFWIEKGMGTSRGFGKFVSKKGFIKKYGGDYEYYFQHQGNSSV